MRKLIRKISFLLVKKYRHSTIPQWYVLIMDILLFVLAFLMMEAFRAGSIQQMSLRGTAVQFILALMVTIIAFFFTGSYRSIIRHAGMSDIYKILIATVGPTLLFWAVNILNNQFRPQIIPNNYLLSYRGATMLYLLLAVEMIILRLFMQRIYNDYFRRKRNNVNVIIYGAGAAGIIAYNALHQDETVEYHVAAFIDDDMSKVNQELNGVSVMRARTVLNPKFIKPPTRHSTSA